MTLWSIYFKYHLPKTPVGKIDDIAYTFALALPHQKLCMRNIKRKTHIKKRVQCMLCPNIIHQKPHGKNGWYDMTLCWYCLIKNFIWETAREKLIEKRVQYDVCNKLVFLRDSPPDTCKYQIKFSPMYSTHKKCWVW